MYLDLQSPGIWVDFMTVMLRATQKVLRSIPKTQPEHSLTDNALGDWYVKRLVIDRQPLLLLVSAASRLAILDYAREVRHLPSRLPELVAERLQRAGIPPRWIEREIEAMTPVLVGPTSDRSITGQMVDFGKTLPFYLPINHWGTADLWEAEAKLGETPCLAGTRNVVFPLERSQQLLSEQWA
jgi:hypothetical protein